MAAIVFSQHLAIIIQAIAPQFKSGRSLLRMRQKKGRSPFRAKRAIAYPQTSVIN
ncbi:MAG: hypothetical protein JGK17_30505 [Microcoleus sp. PH2017_10_PVI_O_A]|uniref:hypothetical protein n=1 Tax=unclassified Microcoleus TaxID=2642155 RepID=UPI001DD0896A|nr:MULTISPECIES: hypothetical protein [unclassified Microcoleus]MCC3409802.1 hypothetical protein [Microcoleus sp. PH2017_10_PVI_O_A]MCC3464088.1 hypothetical protein [Microcoleus sp. PH2017_11_PCY_U_A]MCC3482393.1 hypothetical protein [Microcoleus sp. PH2017_12_PCY_D_A]MCC3530998.1 hypothetical protein [Microcoleus sp. PH2017_21_RUC_O_A]MCC3543355.1 hypothetical protein [Microcoleus sp. PH2017_22_RUC_O_B]